MCTWLGVSKSGFYDWRGPDQRHRGPARAAGGQGQGVVRRLPRHLRLPAVARGAGPWRRAGHPRAGAAADVSARAGGLSASAVAQDHRARRQAGHRTGPAGPTSPPPSRAPSWSPDITFVRTWSGWLYLATVIDCYNNEVNGYAMADHMRTDLVTEALEMAARNHRLAPKCIFHSDRRTQAVHVRGFRRETRRTWYAPVTGTHRGLVMTMSWPNRSSRL